MTILIEKFKQYPLVLWGLALYLCSLGFNLKYDIPLLVFALTSIWAIGNMEGVPVKKILQRHWPLVFFIFATGVIIFFSKDSMQSLKVHIQWLPALLMYVAISSYANDRRILNFILIALIAAILIAEVSFLIQALALVDTPDRLEKIWEIRSPILVSPNDVLFFAMLTPLAAYLVLGVKHWGVRLLGVVYIVLTFGASIYMQSRQATGICIIGIALLALLWRPMVGFAVVIAGVFSVAVIDWINGQVLSSKLIYLFPRTYIWEAAWQMFVERPWAGQGPGMFKTLYVEYLEKAGYVLEEVADYRPMNWAHSLYLEQLAERGVLGFVALFLLIGSSVSGLLKRLNNLKLLEKSLLASWGVFLAAGIAESSLLRLWVVSALLLLAALSFQGKNIKKDNSER